MKHVIVIETAGPIGILQINDLRYRAAALADHIFGDNNFTLSIVNQSSAIRGVYRIYCADESLSPDELQSTK